MAQRTRYEVKDASGALVAVHVRIDEPDGTKRLLWERPAGESGLGELALVDLPLYGVHHLGDWPAHRPIVVTEGEKAAQALIDADICAVGTVTGASSTPGPALGELAGRHVVLWPDNDEVGRAHMKRIAGGLRAIVASLRWAEWPAAPAHGDAADLILLGADAVWNVIDAAEPIGSDRFEHQGLGYVGHFEEGEVDVTFDHIRRSGGDLVGELSVTSADASVSDNGHLLRGSFNVSAMGTRSTIAKALAERAPTLTVDWRGYLERFCRATLEAERQGEPVVIVGNRPRRPAIPYLLDPLLVVGKSTILFGPEGTGKSYLAAAAVVSVESGVSVIPGWCPGKGGHVLILDWEDDEDEWNDRLARICRGANLPPVGVVYRYGRGPLADNVEEVARIVVERKIDLVIVDSVSKAAPPGREGGDPSDSAGRLFAALRYIGGTHLLLDHVPKADRGKAGSERPYGSVMKPAWARVTFELSCSDESDPDDRHLVLVNRKRNSGARTDPKGVGIKYGEDAVTFYDEKPTGETVPLRVRIIAVLGQGAMTYADIASEVNSDPETVRSTMNRARDQFVKVVGADAVTRWALAYRDEKAA